ncbi:hypothetical protein AAHC03_09235 [Spirometra sp. Aus1]
MATADEGLANAHNNFDLRDGIEELKNFKNGCGLLREAINLAWQSKKAKEKVTHSTFGKVIMNLKASNRRTQFKLKELRDATYQFTRPLDSEMGLNVHENEETYQTAFLLPAPLYIIYSHLITFVECKELQSRAQVFIEGDSELARSVNTTGIPRSDEGDADPSELEEQERPAAKRKGRHKSKSAAELGDQAASKHDVPHPLSVCVRISEEPSSKWPNFTLLIRFTWLRKSNLVSVQTDFERPELLNPLSQTGRDLLESENLLSGLEFAVSETAGTPGQVLALSRLAVDAVEPSFLPKLQPSQLGRTFLWAQQLAGLHCLPNLPPVVRVGEKRPFQQVAAGAAASVDGSQSVQASTFGFIDTWFSAVMRRVQSRLLLNSELRAIEDGILNLSEHQKPFFPITEEIGLRTWDRITLDELKSWPRAETFIALDLIQPLDAIFQCQMTYRNRDTLSIGVAIPPCYPDEPSLIILGSVIEPFPTKDITVLHIQELETEVNSLRGKPGVRYRTRSRPLRFLPKFGVFTYR